MRQIRLTGDGFHTICLPARNITYHSRRGAIQESRHVFIYAGLLPLLGRQDALHIFEMGFDTDLNALLALKEALQSGQKIHYTAVEAFPSEETEYNRLNYCDVLNDTALHPFFIKMHETPWESDIAIHLLFTLTKVNSTLAGAMFAQTFDCIFFYAFAPNDQPELWTAKIFEKMFAILKNNGILVTYCRKGAVGRSVKAAGVTVEEIAGPPGKRR